MENVRYSFTDLFNKEIKLDKDTHGKVSSIVIPLIQRPYAQGRTDVMCTHIRNTFLNEIFETLTSDNNDILDLNFVYGSIIPIKHKEEYKMELLDGQQRLTTLFLLYWYITNAEKAIDEIESQKVRECLSKFRYETRTTSTVFCQSLSSYTVEVDGETPSLKEVIRNAKWYFKSFDHDSTIRSMLTMLDDIHKKYIQQGQRNLFDKLENLKFHVLSLGEFNLSEELYIKMNARGLQLSPFENFKADLSNFISNKEIPEFQKEVPLYNSDDDTKVPFHLNFSVKLDTKWVDIFWTNGPEDSDKEDFDKAYMIFFSRFFACKHIITTKHNKDKDFKILYTDAEEHIDSNEYFGFEAFKKILDNHPEYIDTLDKVLDVIYDDECKSNERVIYKNMCPVWDKKEGDDFYCKWSKMTLAKLVALSAVIEYIEARGHFDVTTFKCWMRVVWNVIENTNIDGLDPAAKLIRKLSDVIHSVAKNMMNDNKSFYAALSQWTEDREEENEDSKKENLSLLEEIEKARRISEDPAWELIWKNVEQHPYFKGMVTFFYRPEILSKGENEVPSDGEEIMSKDKYERRSKLAKKMFDKEGISEGYRKEHILIRAIVSQFSTWEEINRLYITERADPDKRLKHILATNKKVRAMFVDITNKESEEKVKAALQDYIDNANKPQPYNDNGVDLQDEYLQLALKRLRDKDEKIYDWIEEKEKKSPGKNFRVQKYAGHIMLAIPCTSFDKIALDTERAKMAYNLHEKFGFEFCDKNQQIMYEGNDSNDKYKECFGNHIEMKKTIGNYDVMVIFDTEHKLNIRIAYDPTKESAVEQLFEELKKAENVAQGNMSQEDSSIQLTLTIPHSTAEKTYHKLCKSIEKIKEIIK